MGTVKDQYGREIGSTDYSGYVYSVSNTLTNFQKECVGQVWNGKVYAINVDVYGNKTRGACVGHVESNGKIYSSEMNNNSAYCVGHVDIMGNVFNDEFSSSQSSTAYKGSVSAANTYESGAAALLLLLSSPSLSYSGGGETFGGYDYMRSSGSYRHSSKEDLKVTAIALGGIGAIILFIVLSIWKKSDLMPWVSMVALGIGAFCFIADLCTERPKLKPWWKVLIWTVLMPFALILAFFGITILHLFVSVVFFNEEKINTVLFSSGMWTLPVCFAYIRKTFFKKNVASNESTTEKAETNTVCKEVNNEQQRDKEVDCGNTEEKEVKLEDTCSKDEEEVYFEITCPKCEKVFYVDNKAISSGELTCPNCKTLLEIDN